VKHCNLGINDVIRVGSRSKSESLNNFMLKNVKMRRRSRTMGGLFYNEKEMRKEAKEELEKHVRFKQALNESIVECQDLKEYMSPNEMYHIKDDVTLLKWLGFLNDNFHTEEEQLEHGFEGLNLENTDHRDNSNENRDNGDSNNKQHEDSDEETARRTIDTGDKIDYNELIRNEYDLIHNTNVFKISIGDTYSKISLIKMNGIQRLIEKMEESCGFQMVGSSHYKNIKRNLRRIMSTNPEVEDSTAKYTDLIELVSPFEMPLSSRFARYNRWINKIRNKLDSKLADLRDKFNQSIKSMNDLRLQEDGQVMKDSLIIAMTTTGSARYHEVLRNIGPRIVIVEEAAEVFEAHIVSSLSKDCEHLILIGDHVQLRPNPAVFKLAQNFKLDVSLFERLVNNDLKRVMLNCQHRMRPEISYLMKNFYPQAIKDHESVFNFDNINGVNKNIYFINHQMLENTNDRRNDNDEDCNSKTNLHEASFLTKFCAYIVKRGQFEETQITILSMYLGQLMVIRSQLKRLKLDKVKVSTVDNYQGEENQIIMLSLVRSNLNETVGFLKTNNRICVALSRSKCGMFCIGNFTMIAKKSDTWKNIVDEAKTNGNFGESILLSCARHKENDILAKMPNDFDLRPEGGCHLPCKLFRF
jgi:superfamily I DNA and/or RNA helicase